MSTFQRAVSPSHPHPVASQTIATTPPVAGPAGFGRSGARHLYHALLAEHGAALGEIDELTRAASRAWLAHLLETVGRVADGPPADPRELAAWLAQGHADTRTAYRSYLDGRRAGAPRRFFRNRSHALHFLMSVAPTKQVDGAWLYGLLSRWNDPRLQPLIRTYLEELGDGVPAQHHVLIYRQHLAQHGTDRSRQLGDEHHLQGAIQLALAHNAAEFLPEVIGFNLGYEQLPLHLPITAYELNELDIDPYYFSLHVTIDNASTGHAAKSLECALACLPRVADSSDFYRRLCAGFKLNDLGVGTLQAIDSFDLERELVAVLVDKALLGAELHSDYCRIGGRTVTDWLSTPGGMPAFLEALVAAGWIRRGVDPVESRFWRLLQDDRAPMFGVFDGYELQLIRDWIADAPDGSAVGPSARPHHVNRFRQRPAANSGRADGAALASTSAPAPAPALSPSAGVAQTVRHHFALSPANGDADVEALGERLADVGNDREAAMSVLRPFLSPANHPTPAGLLATRIFARLLGP